ncbi:MAG: hypothetical protein GW748_05525 [Alphaproteobacteria bacterium]|nr:hypothetical protein [Alphaproteobacteria bacterium]NCQ67185.1 hypothetical protein [Alphaproteobacteria bacterium]NCT07030.1 hypothetical protein [Alphaproteobacteria bacterium]
MKNIIFALSTLAFTTTINATNNGIAYDIDDQNSVSLNFRLDQNSGSWASLPIEAIHNIASSTNISKELYPLSKGFRALHLAGVLPVSITLNGQYFGRVTDELIADLSEAVLNFRNVYKLSIRYLPIVEDISHFSNVKHIRLDGVKSVSGILPTLNAQSVDLSGCRDITDISGLAGVDKVSISQLFSVEDFSALQNVKELTIYSQPQLNDVSIFSQVSKLTIGYCKNVIDLSPLAQVKDLTISGMNQVDTSMLGKDGQLLTIK